MRKVYAIKFDVPENIKNAVADENFRCYVRNEGESAELLIMDQIGESWDGEGVSADSVVTFLNANQDKTVSVRINSPGGLVYDGLVIYNALASHPQDVTVTIEGLAYSAASFIAMAGDTIRMHEASDIGIHRASGVSVGNSRTMLAVADWLDSIDEHLVDIYTARTGQEPSQIEEWLDGRDDGTLFSAKEAVKHGFADELIPLNKGKHRKEAKQAQGRQRVDALRRTVARAKHLTARLDSANN